ncbi:MAG TPA: ABC transporter ATP-binding protein [Candidatus Acidoferrales bacterium]|nr:ABC transporter ATP-binding protein [Candidatus Acidoferrales bacterium]
MRIWAEAAEVIATQTLLEVRNLRASYGEIEALRDVSFTVEPGAIVALLGANGAGKSTCLRAITGMVRRSGSIVFEGTAIESRATEDIARLGIAHVPEGRGTLAELSVRENLALGGYLLDSARAKERYARVVSYFPWIEERAKQQAGTLSGGEQQMLAIARALMMKPKMMLLDEPSLGLAPRIVEEIFALLRTINRDENVTILLAEQNAAMAFAAASHVYVLETGRVAAAGPSDVLARDDRVRKSYLGH